MKSTGLFLLFILCVSFQAGAKVTYDGTNGIAAQLFPNCTGCHDGSDPILAPVDVKFTSYAEALTVSAYTSPETNAAAGLLRATVSDDMPPAGALSGALQSLYTSWASDGYLEKSAPTHESLGDSNVTKYTATLNASIGPNGTSTSAYFMYGKTSDLSFPYSYSFTTNNTALGSGGDGVDSLVASLTGLDCGSTYYYRSRASGSSVTYSGQGSFATNNCPTIDVPGDTTATEDIQHSETLSYNDPDGDSLVFSLDTLSFTPPGDMAISSGGQITWTPVDGVLTSGTIYVEATDGTHTATRNYTITVTPVNDPPEIDEGPNPNGDTIAEDDNFTWDINATDPDAAGDSIYWKLISSPAEGTVNFNTSTGLIEWTPGNTPPVSGVFEIEVRDRLSEADPDKLTDTTTFTLFVNEENDPPEITSTQADITIGEDTTFLYDMEATDPETPGALVYSFIDNPTGATIDPDTGEIVWLPGDNPPASDVFNIQVSDLFLTDTQSFTITVTASNDAPVISSVAGIVANETEEYSYQLVWTDPDTFSGFTFSLDGNPAGMNVSATGLVSWTPSIGDTSSGAVTITVDDNDGGQDFEVFTVSVSVPDQDEDTVADYDDNCIAVPNEDQADNDGDDEGDLCDTDDDNDGISDKFEKQNGLDKFNPDDASEDRDNDGKTNLEEYLAGSDLDVDDQPPTISLVSPLIIPATGYFTFIDLINAGEVSAEDFHDGELIPVTESGDTYRPGLYDIEWKAEDAAGNIATASQQLRVLPILLFKATDIIPEGTTHSIEFTLNGDAPVYPVTVDFRVSGTSTVRQDHSLRPGSFTIESDRKKTLDIVVHDDGSGDNNEDLIIRLTSISNATLDPASNSNDSIKLLLTEDNLPPAGLIKVEQGNDRGTFVFANQGLVSIIAGFSDQEGGELGYDWSASSTAITGLAAEGVTSDTLTIDPSALTPGTYLLRLEVSDNAHTLPTSSVLTVLADEVYDDPAGDLDDDGIDNQTEGYSDSDNDGIPDWRDNIDESNLLQTQTGDAGTVSLLQTQAGYQIMPGILARYVGRSGALVSIEDISNFGGVSGAPGTDANDEGFSHINGIYDFVITGFPANVRSASVVIPLHGSIAENAVYRKYLPATGWQNFVLNNHNRLSSAQRLDGYCPSIISSNYRAGLNAGDDCLRLTIEDGGANDSDGVRNGSISDPGGLSVSTPENGQVTPWPSQKSGSAVSIYLLLFLMVVFHRRRVLTRQN